MLTLNSIVGKTGYYYPWALLSALLVAIGAGLLSTVHAHTALVRPIIYQFIAGFGRGCGMQTVSYFYPHFFSTYTSCLNEMIYMAEKLTSTLNLLASDCHPKRTPP
jgi:hypothetical protein